ncbi:hypothetical protein PtB15_1B464 [Puccinia triticina]|nr:hypothetical protein PtB15_1B464 [Puccinia triticina]
MPALKAWTQMNVPASSHRWRTLQLYLREQRHYLELERRAKRSIDLENERTEELIRSNTDSLVQSSSMRTPTEAPRSDYQFLHTVPRAKITHRASSTTLLSNGLILETLDVSKDEKEAAKYRANDNKLAPTSGRRVSSSSSAIRNGTAQSPRTSTMNINSLTLNPDSLNAVAGMDQALSSHPGTPSTRPPSPHRFSFASRKSGGFGESMRPFSTWGRNRRSASNSVLSLAPSGSMIDMHVGLSQDRHLTPGSFPSSQIGQPIPKNRSMLNFHQSLGGPPMGAHQQEYTHKPSLGSMTSSPTAARFAGLGDERTADGMKKENKKKLRHTLKGLWMKLGLGRQRACSIDQIGSPSPLGTQSRGRAAAHANADDEPLDPPPSLSVLAREQQSHRRNRSTLSLPLTNVRRFGGFRPQSSSTATMGGGPDSSLSSPVSHQFLPPSPGAKMSLHSGSAAQSPYIAPNNDPLYDSLAEELETPARQHPHQQPRSRVRSLGTTSLFNELATTQEEEDDPRLPKRASTLDPASSTEPLPGLTNHTSTVSCSRPTSTNHTTAAADKSPSVRTVLSKSSKIFHKLSTINLAASASKRRSSSGGSMSNNNNSLASSTNLRPTPHLRTSTSSVFSATNTPGPGPDGSPDHHQQLHPAHSQFIHQHPPFNTAPPAHRPDYLPSEKTRNGVSRSADFLALRYVSLSRDDQILGHHHQS